MSVYIVVKGDTFDAIAQRLGVTEADFKNANSSININQLTPGEKLHVPGDAPNTTYTVKSGDTGTSIAQKDNTTLAEVEKLNPNVNWNNLQVGATLIVPRD